jgi:hypothetical protein
MVGENHSSHALTPGRVPHVRPSVHGLRKMAKPFQGSHPAEYTVAKGVKAFEKDRIRPMYAEANMGHPSRRKGLV